MELGNGFKQTEVGIIPNDWDVVDLFELADRKKALFDDGDWIESEHITDEGIRLIQTGNIGIGRYVEKNLKKYIYTSSFEILKCKELQIGDLLICRLAEPAGRSCILPKLEDNRIVTSVDVTIFRPLLNKANRRFLNQIFATRRWLENVSENSGGTTHKRISRGRLAKLFIQLPSIIEQDKIASALCDVDSLIDRLESLIEKKKNIKQGAMQQLLKPKKGWEIKTIKEVATYRRGSFPQPYGLDKWYDDISGFPFIQVFDVDDNKRLKNETKRYISKAAQQMSVFVEKGSIILTIQGSIGRIAITQYDAYVDRTLLIFETFKVPFNSFFFMISIWRIFEIEKELAPGGIIKTITKEALSSFKISYPNIVEQERIANILSDIDNEIFTLEEKLHKSKSIKQGMMQNLLTGKIRLV
jgi:type I restriction enzyme S subunit